MIYSNLWQPTRISGIRECCAGSITASWWLSAYIHIIGHGVDIVVAIRLYIHIVIQHINRTIAEHAIVASRLVVAIAIRVADEAGTLIRAQALAFGQRGHIEGMLHRGLVQPEALACLGRAF